MLDGIHSYWLTDSLQSTCTTGPVTESIKKVYCSAEVPQQLERIKLKRNKSKLPKTLGVGTGAVGSTVCCLHDYPPTFKIVTCGEWGHILDMSCAETIASETKNFLCCPESSASKAGLLEKTTKPNWLIKLELRKATLKPQYAAVLSSQKTGAVLLQARPRGCARLFSQLWQWHLVF